MPLAADHRASADQQPRRQTEQRLPPARLIINLNSRLAKFEGEKTAMAALGLPARFADNVGKNAADGIREIKSHEPALANADELCISLARASSYSRFNLAIYSAVDIRFSTTPTPWPEPQISFQAFALLPPLVAKFIVDLSPCGRLFGSMPAAATDGAR